MVFNAALARLRPRGALCDPVFSLEKEFNEHGKTRLVRADIADDPGGLFFAVFFL